MCLAFFFNREGLRVSGEDKSQWNERQVSDFWYVNEIFLWVIVVVIIVESIISAATIIIVIIVDVNVVVVRHVWTDMLMMAYNSLVRLATILIKISLKIPPHQIFVA